MRRTWRKAKPKIEKKFRCNEQIRVPEVFLIGDDGDNVGIILTSEAKRMAEESGLDLVEVNPKADPPVVRIMDYGQFKYEAEKKAHKQKQQQKKVDTKGIRLSVRISNHDLDLRESQAIKFFKKGHKLKIDLILKGRERAHPEKAREIINEFVQRLEKNPDLKIEHEQPLTRQGGRFIMILVNKND